jgi:hypothetical protein
MAIEELGESLLAQAKSRRKKEEKKGKLFGAALLGVQVGNMFLRKQAEKRANEFWTSNRGLIDKKTKQFQAGMNFWTDHNTMMKGYGMGATDTDWKNAFKQKQYDIYKQRELGKTKLSELNAEKLKEFENMVNPLIEDDIKAYEQKLELFRNFENIKDTEANKKLFLAPVTNKFAEAKKIIDKEANVGSYLLNKLGLRETGLETVTVEGQDVLLPRRMSSEKKQVIVDNIKLNNMYLKNIDDIDKTVKYTPFTDEQIAQFVSTSSWKSKIPEDLNSAFNRAIGDDPSSVFSQQKYFTSLSDRELNISKIYKQIEKDQQAEGADMFKSDVISFAMEARKQYEANPENRGKPKSADYFLNIGMENYINSSELISEKAKEEINLREKEEINRQFMNSEIQIGENKVTPLQIQKAFLSGQYTQEQKENLYMQLVKQFENIPQAQGFLNNLESSISRQDEEETKISPFFQYETKFRKNPLST